jgi:hypothetical protein
MLVDSDSSELRPVSDSESEIKLAQSESVEHHSGVIDDSTVDIELWSAVDPNYKSTTPIIKGCRSNLSAKSRGQNAA